MVSKCTIQHNLQNGIAAMGNVSASLLVVDTTILQNLATGLLVGGTCKCRVRGCRLGGNKKDGVGVAARAVVTLEACEVTPLFYERGTPVINRARMDHRGVLNHQTIQPEYSRGCVFHSYECV